MPAFALVGHDVVALAAPVGIAHTVPVFQALGTVDQRDPSVVGHVRATGRGERENEQRRRYSMKAFHGDLSCW